MERLASLAKHASQAKGIGCIRESLAGRDYFPDACAFSMVKKMLPCLTREGANCRLVGPAIKQTLRGANLARIRARERSRVEEEK